MEKELQVLRQEVEAVKNEITALRQSMITQDINMNKRALTGKKYIQGETVFNGEGDIFVTPNRKLLLQKFGMYGGVLSRFFEVIEVKFDDTSYGVGFRLGNGNAGLLLCSDGKIRVKNHNGNWEDTKLA